MTTIRIAMVFFVLMFALPAFAELEYKVIETENGFVVEAEGTPVDSAEKTKERIRQLEIDIKVRQIRIDSLQKSKPLSQEEMDKNALDLVEIMRKLVTDEIELAESTITDPQILSAKKEQLSDKLAESETAYNKHQDAVAERSKFADRTSDVKVSGVVVFPVETTQGYTRVSIKADIDNRGPSGRIWVTIVGKNWEGSTLETIEMRDEFGKNESITVTAVTTIPQQTYLNIRTWEVGKVRKN